MRLRILACALTTFCLGGAPAAADEPHLGTPEVITSFGGESNVLAASSAAGHPDAYAVFHSKIGANVYSVVHRDRSGHAHRFDLPTRSGTFPEAIRIVALEAGGGMAIWDDGRRARVLARSWRSDGRLGATQVVLSQVTTVHSADSDSAQWRVRADGRGTVVVATTGAAPHGFASVFAAVRDPGGPFRVQQELTPPEETGVDQRQISISPIATDGTVGIAWGPEYGDGAGGAAVRSGRAASFGAAAARPFTVEVGLDAQHRTVIAADGALVTVSARLARLCPCVRPQVFRWGGGVRVLAFQISSRAPSVESGSWYVARPDARGVFDRAVKATENATSVPVRRARAGEVGFARFDTSTDNSLFRRHSRLVVVPFGAKVARSRRAPRLRFGTSARSTGRRLLVPVYCDRVCRVNGSAGVARALAVTDFEGKRIDSRLEPFTVAYLRVTLRAGRAKVRVSARATDDAGHRAAANVRFLRSPRRGTWCIAGTSRC